MKEQLIKLANEKCFLSKLSIILSGIEYIPKTIEKYIEDIEYYLWMCELHKWLRDNHLIHVDPYLIHSFNNNIEMMQEKDEMSYTYRISVSGLSRLVSSRDVYFSNEKALEKGLFEALKLIK